MRSHFEAALAGESSLLHEVSVWPSFNTESLGVFDKAVLANLEFNTNFKIN